MAIDVTGTAQTSAWQRGVLPPREQVRAGVWSVPIPIPGSPLRYTLCYLVAGGRKLLVIDPGWDSEQGWQSLVEAIAETGYSLDQVAGCALTHVHPDHIGLAARLKRETGAWVTMHMLEAEILSHRIGLDETVRLDREWVTRCGVPSARQDELITKARHLEFLNGAAIPDWVVGGCGVIILGNRLLRVFLTPGHSPGHICLVDDTDRLVFTGDHILPRISPGVGLGRLEHGDNPLRDYLHALAAASRIGDYEVCPGHEYRFSGLAARASELIEHHQHRAEEIVWTLAELPRPSVWSIAERLTWSRGWASLSGFHLRAALSETECHLVYLFEEGRITWQPSAGS